MVAYAEVDSWIVEKISLLPNPNLQESCCREQDVTLIRFNSLAATNGSEDNGIEPYCLSDVGFVVVAAKLEKLSLMWCSTKCGAEVYS